MSNDEASRDVDPDGLDPKNPWADLTDDERKLLAPKLTTVNGNDQMAAAQAVFNTLVRSKTKNDQQVADNVASVQNFVASLGHDDKAWGQIKSIDTVVLSGDGKQSGINFTVDKPGEFIDALKAMKDPATGAARFIYLGSHDVGDHKDSTRELGQDYGDPSMHIESNGSSGFSTHWDVSSPLREPTLWNLTVQSTPYGAYKTIQQGRRHSREGAATTAAVREGLKKKGLVPR